MDAVIELLSTFAGQLQKPTLAFLIGGMAIAALGSKLDIPDAIYRFIVFMLLMRVGIGGGMEIRDSDLSQILLPALMAVILGCAIVLIGRFTLAAHPSLKTEDGIATAGLFGAVSASTMAAGMLTLEEEGIAFEAWVPALYPFMDIPALVLAIVLASVHRQKQRQREGGPGDAGDHRVRIWPIVAESLRGSALSALLLGMALGIFTKPDSVFEQFYDPLFRGLLSVLMLIMGIEAWQRLAELRRVAQWYAVYALLAPIVHGLLGFALGYVAHVATGFSPGGVILLAIIAASSSDISGPPTLRAGIPSANPSAYIGASTAIGTPVAVAICIPLFLTLGQFVFEP